MTNASRQLLDYTGRTVVITGAATGMGNETVRLLLDAGAEVHALDIAPVEAAVAAAHRCDLGDPASIDEAVGSLPAHVDSLMNCAGIPNGAHWDPIEIIKVNFLGLRHLTEALIDKIPAGGSVTSIASIAGQGWPSHVAELGELMGTASFDEGVAWCEAQADLIADGYSFSKEAVQFYTMWRSAQTIKTGVRMNAICPGVTDTKIMADFRRGMGDAAIDMAADAGIGRLAEAHEMAPALIFLASPEAASYISGVNLVIDGGFTAALTTGQIDFSQYDLG